MGLLTGTRPMYIAGMVFRGSSMGVGNSNEFKSRSARFLAELPKGSLEGRVAG